MVILAVRWSLNEWVVFELYIIYKSQYHILIRTQTNPVKFPQAINVGKRKNKTQLNKCVHFRFIVALLKFNNLNSFKYTSKILILLIPDELKYNLFQVYNSSTKKKDNVQYFVVMDDMRVYNTVKYLKLVYEPL